MQRIAAAALGLAAGAVALGVALRGARAGRAEVEPEPEPERRPFPRPRPAPVEADDDEGDAYIASTSAPYGPYHGARRPSGLPLLVVEASGSAGRVMVDGIAADVARREALDAYGARFKMTPSSVRVRPVRQASERGGALRAVAEEAERRGLGMAFVKVISHLARTEGEGGTFAVAARNFNAGCTTPSLSAQRYCTPVDFPRRPGSLVTAWGVFQWNRDAGRALKTLDGLGLQAPYIPPDWMPWDWTAAEEIVIPINYYAQLWALVRRKGRSELDAARGVRLWHTGPSRFRRFLNDGADPKAWSKVADHISGKIDHHLKSAGVT